MTLLAIPLWFAALSLLVLFLMWFDKHSAQTGRWRIPERTLLLWAFLGGALGAKLAQRRFRHKTRKQPFAHLLNAALAANGVLALLLLNPSLRDALVNALLAYL